MWSYTPSRCRTGTRLSTPFPRTAQSVTFKNWRGMSDSGGWRIKRCINLDAASVRFLSEEEVAKFRRFDLLDERHRRQAERVAAAQSRSRGATGRGEPAPPHKYRYLSGLCTTTWRSGDIRGHDLAVRQLASGPEGIPIELYCFTNTTAWGEYEGIQGDIFDHLLAIVPEFGLRLYQPAGTDLAGIGMASEISRAESPS